MDTMSVNGKDFTVIKLLGKGKGGYSYLVSDGEHNYVLKQIHHEPCSYYTFGNKIQSELNDYERLKMPDSDCRSLLTAMWKTRGFLKITLTAKPHMSLFCRMR